MGERDNNTERKLKKQPWFAMAVALCIAILFYFILSNLDTAVSVVGTVCYYIYPIIAGVILAYLINPLMKLFEHKVLGKMKKPGIRRALALAMAIIIVLVLIALIIWLLIPDLYGSIVTIYNNKDEYLNEIYDVLDKWGATSILTYLQGLTSGKSSLFETVIGFLGNNGEAIKDGVMTIGGHLGAWGIGLIFSIYFLAAKDKIIETSKKLLGAMLRTEKRTSNVLKHLTRMNEIVSKYLAFTIVDSILIGVATAIFMVIFGMEYVGLLAVLIGVTNLIPTFGPVIGTVLGAVILLLSNPWHALAFVIFELVYQTLDGYVIRPKLFGKTLGVSGLWILVAIIVGGRILGVIGILISIPVVAIIDYLIKEVYLPSRREKAKKDKETEGEKTKEVTKIEEKKHEDDK